MTRYPRNGENLLRLRSKGMRPAGLVLVSLIGTLRETNYTVYAAPDERYDWAMMAALDVELVVSRAVPFRAVLHALADLAQACPAHLTLCYAEGARVECGRSRYAPHAINPVAGRITFDWFPSAVNPCRESHLLEQRLWRELGAGLPVPYDAAMHRASELLAREVAPCN